VRGLVVKSIRLVVSRPGFDSLAKSDQKTYKVGIHSFPAWRKHIFLAQPLCRSTFCCGPFWRHPFYCWSIL